MSIDKPELDAGRAVWNAIREIYADKPRMYINPEQAWKDLNRESQLDCRLIAQAAIATVMNAGYSLADKTIGVKNDKTVSEVQSQLDVTHKTLRYIRRRLSELRFELAMFEQKELAYLGSYSQDGIINQLKNEFTRSKDVELSYSVNAIPVVFTGDPDPDYVVAKVAAKQIHCCKRDGRSGFMTDLTGKIHTSTHSRQLIDMQATFGKGSVEPNSIKTCIVIEDKQ